MSHEGKAIRVWDLRLIRQQLVALGLDWDEPPYPPAPPTAPAAARHRRRGLNGEQPGRDAGVGVATCSLRSWGIPSMGTSTFSEAASTFSWAIRPRMSELNMALALQPHHPRPPPARQAAPAATPLASRLRRFHRTAPAQPDDHEVHRLRGQCRVALADFAAAAVDYRAWLKHGGANAETLNHVAWQLVGKAKDRKDAELALPLIEKAVASDHGVAHRPHAGRHLLPARPLQGGGSDPGTLGQASAAGDCVRAVFSRAVPAQARRYRGRQARLRPGGALAAAGRNCPRAKSRYCVPSARKRRPSSRRR